MSALFVRLGHIPRSPLLCMSSSALSWLTALSVFTLFENLIVSYFYIPVTDVVVIGLIAKLHRSTVIQR